MMVYAQKAAAHWHAMRQRMKQHEQQILVYIRIWAKMPDLLTVHRKKYPWMAAICDVAQKRDSELIRLRRVPL